MSDESDQVLSAFGFAIRTRRKELGWSQERLAEKACLHRTYVADIERGRRNLSLLNIIKLAAALRLAPAQLFSNQCQRGAADD